LLCAFCGSFQVWLSRSFQSWLDRNFSLSANINTQRALLTSNAVDCCTGHEIAIKSDCTRCVVIAWNWIVDLVWITVRINHCNDRNTKTLGFLNSNRLFIGINDEHQIRNRSHILDTTQSTIKFFTLALKIKAFLLGEPLRLTSKKIIKLTQTLNGV